MSLPPKVALFPSAFHPHVGGVEELSLRYGLQLAGRGSTPLVVTHQFPATLPHSEIVEGLPVVRERFAFPAPRPRALLGYAVHSPRTRRRLRRSVARYAPDVLHIQCVSSQSRYVLALRDQLRVPLVVSLQGELTMDANQAYQRSPALRRLWRRTLDAADAITGCSAFVLNEAEAAYGRPFGDRARVIPNGVASVVLAGPQSRTTRSPYVFAAGRLVPQKGFDVLLRAFQDLQNEPDLELRLAGDGPASGLLRALAVELGLGDRVHFLGSQPHDSVMTLFANAAVAVVPSLHEPQGIVVLEAMAAGCPVVASSVGGIPETIEDGLNGLLFPAQDHVALARVLRTVLRDSTWRGRLAAAGKRTAATRDWSLIADRYLEVYQSI